MSHDYDSLWEYRDFDEILHACISHYGDECAAPYLEPFSRIQEISDDYIDGFLNTLCYFYPDFIADYFKLFIYALRKRATEYLKSRQ